GRSSLTPVTETMPGRDRHPAAREGLFSAPATSAAAAGGPQPAGPALSRMAPRSSCRVRLIYFGEREEATSIGASVSTRALAVDHPLSRLGVAGPLHLDLGGGGLDVVEVARSEPDAGGGDVLPEA